jgi:hypothetical protein
MRPAGWQRCPVLAGGVCLAVMAISCSSSTRPAVGLRHQAACIFIHPREWLMTSLGEPYRAYAAGKKRLVPRVW